MRASADRQIALASRSAASYPRHMTVSRDMMESDPLIVSPGMQVKELARELLDTKLDGACVVSEGKLVGVVTAMDLVYREKRLHLPSFVSFMDFMIPLEAPERYHEEVHKMAGRTVGEIMSSNPVTVRLDSPLSETASLMVERHLTMLPVVDDEGRLVGVITKVALLKKAYGLED
jgi:CBS domain-containing protein